MEKIEFDRIAYSYIEYVKNNANDSQRVHQYAASLVERSNIAVKIYNLMDRLRNNYLYFQDDQITDVSKEDRWKTVIVDSSSCTMEDIDGEEVFVLKFKNYKVFFNKAKTDPFAERDYSNPYSTTPELRTVDIYVDDELVFNPTFRYEWTISKHSKPSFSQFRLSNWFYELLTLSEEYLHEQDLIDSHKKKVETLNNFLPPNTRDLSVQPSKEETRDAAPPRSTDDWAPLILFLRLLIIPLVYVVILTILGG